MWVMVSGIKRVIDAEIALRMGANAYGLIVEQSRNSLLSPEIASEIAKSMLSADESLLPFKKKTQQDYQNQSSSLPIDSFNQLRRIENLYGGVLVTHITDVNEIIRLALMINVTIIQLAGDVPPEDIIIIKKSLPDIKLIKTLPVLDNTCISHVKRYIDLVDAIELDTFDALSKRTGGTGRTHDWNISRTIVEEYGWQVPIILAGGLHCDNIEKAIRMVKPVGIDVSSGIKDNRGIPDNEKLAAFLSRANRFENSPGSRQAAYDVSS